MLALSRYSDIAQDEITIDFSDITGYPAKLRVGKNAEGLFVCPVNDAIRIITGQDNNCAGCTWKNMQNDKKREIQLDLYGMSLTYRFKGVDNKYYSWSIITLTKGFFLLPMLLAHPNAVTFRTSAANKLCSYFAGNDNLIKEIQANAESNHPFSVILRQAQEADSSFSEIQKLALLDLEVCKLECGLRKQDDQHLSHNVDKPNHVIGCIYAVVHPYFSDFIKIGATTRDPFTRCMELSRTSLPIPFELIDHVPTFNPFALEKVAHAHFKNFRVNMSSEFFKITIQQVKDYFQKLVIDYHEGRNKELYNPPPATPKSNSNSKKRQFADIAEASQAETPAPGLTELLAVINQRMAAMEHTLSIMDRKLTGLDQRVCDLERGRRAASN